VDDQRPSGQTAEVDERVLEDLLKSFSKGLSPLISDSLPIRTRCCMKPVATTTARVDSLQKAQMDDVALWAILHWRNWQNEQAEARLEEPPLPPSDLFGRIGKPFAVVTSLTRFHQAVIAFRIIIQLVTWPV